MLHKPVMRHTDALPLVIRRDEPSRFEALRRAPADIPASHQGFQFGWETILPEIESLLKMTVRMGGVLRMPLKFEQTGYIRVAACFLQPWR